MAEVRSAKKATLDGVNFTLVASFLFFFFFLEFISLAATTKHVKNSFISKYIRVYWEEVDCLTFFMGFVAIHRMLGREE